MPEWVNITFESLLAITGFFFKKIDFYLIMELSPNMFPTGSYKKCRLCDMKLSDTNFEPIDAVIRNTLDALLLKLKFDDDIQYFMCSNCAVKLFAALDFKTVCLNTDNTIITYVNIEEPSAVDLKEIYVKEKGISNLCDKRICRLCMHPVNGEFVSVEEVQTSSIQMYIPEINFEVTADPIICKMCYDSLFTHSSFIKNCLNVEEQRTYQDESPIMDTHLSDSCIKIEENEIKHEVENEENEETFGDTQFIGIQLKEEIKQESEPLHFSDNATSTDNIEQFNSGLLQHEPRYKGHLAQHLLTHKEPSDVPMYKCSECEYETKFKSNLNSHQLRHNSLDMPIHKCNECKYETRYKNALVVHRLRHKDPSKVQMYKCSVCNYGTKYKNSLEVHQLKHKDSSEVQMYKCRECEFETKYKTCLARHVLRHEEPSEVQMYKCYECPFKSKHKRSLISHQVTHKDPSEVNMYECSECGYETKYKNALRKHQLRHKDPSEVQMYECCQCQYKSRYKMCLASHQLRHKDPSELKMYKCSQCQFQTRYRNCLARHASTHKEPSEVQMDKCGEIKYENKSTFLNL